MNAIQSSIEKLRIANRNAAVEAIRKSNITLDGYIDRYTTDILGDSEPMCNTQIACLVATQLYIATEVEYICVLTQSIDNFIHGQDDKTSSSLNHIYVKRAAICCLLARYQDVYDYFIANRNKVFERYSDLLKRVQFLPSPVISYMLDESALIDEQAIFFNACLSSNSSSVSDSD